jgi:cell division protease FtsH
VSLRALILPLLMPVAVLALMPASAVADATTPPVVTSAKAGGESFVYSDLRRAATDGRVRRAELDPQRAEATVWLSGGRREEVGVPPGSDLADRLSAAGARVEVRRPRDRTWLLSVVVSLALAAAVAGLFFWLRRRPRLDGDPGDAKRHAGPSPARQPAVRFADVAGCEEAVDEVREFVAFLCEPKRFARVGADAVRPSAPRPAGNRQDPARQSARRRGRRSFLRRLRI